ncbi:unnamed protein product [Albugo candida]|uniref:Uncharacterized protein n=1 Tax=Albugo candida TaxID=65357 RepID=A0A024FVT7_9STRA|nr:unnamed protein product [Albugo candida]|eukprot:CCI10779.1 unnamed protein product [Albugo candida]
MPTNRKSIGYSTYRAIEWTYPELFIYQKYIRPRTHLMMIIVLHVCASSLRNLSLRKLVKMPSHTKLTNPRTRIKSELHPNHVRRRGMTKLNVKNRFRYEKETVVDRMESLIGT